MDLNSNIKKWVNIDTEIKNLNILLKKKREERNSILKSVLHYKNTNSLELENKIIKYNSEILKFVSYRQYNAITYDFIKECLHQLINDKEQIDFIINYLKQKRKYKDIEDIKRLKT